MVVAVLAGSVASCSGSGSGDPSPDDPVILKLSYFRALHEPRTKKLEPNFRTVMSESWRDRMGEGVREPLARAAPGKIYIGYRPDIEMSKYLKRLKEFGLEDLKSRRTQEINPDEFGRLCLDPAMSSKIRIFTVGTEQGARSYLYTDQQFSRETIEEFIKCEAYIIRACEYTINMRATSDPLPGRDK